MQLSHTNTYLDLDLSITEQREEFDSFAADGYYITYINFISALKSFISFEIISGVLFHGPWFRYMLIFWSIISSNASCIVDLAGFSSYAGKPPYLTY